MDQPVTPTTPEQMLEEKVLGDVEIKINTLTGLPERNMNQEAELADLESQKAYLLEVITQKKEAIEKARVAAEQAAVANPEANVVSETPSADNPTTPEVSQSTDSVVPAAPEQPVNAGEASSEEAPREVKLQVVNDTMKVLLNSLTKERGTGEINREYAIAETHLETAQMYFEKALKNLKIIE